MTHKNIAIKVHNLHKSFDAPEQRVTSIKQVFVGLGRKSKKQRQVVLDGIDFEVSEGDFFGIVGRNGSGKSTLLKILAGVYSPDTGAVSINGELTPFIELGVGFNPELSGKDNVYLSASLLGFNRDSVDKMYDEIVHFAELEEHMDKKLKNYSSGMQVRLAFSIAVKTTNDILIFDEVLAVGDEAFQHKCTDMFERYKAEKQTIILVTHDMASVKKFCNKAILLDNGKIVASGDPQLVADQYTRKNEDSMDVSLSQKSIEPKEGILKIGIYGKDGKASLRYVSGEFMRVSINWPNANMDGIESIGVTVVKNTGEHVSGINSRYSKNISGWNARNRINLDVQLSVYPGRYHLIVEAFSKPGVVAYAEYKGPEFTVKKSKIQDWSGLVKLEHKWSMDE